MKELENKVALVSSSTRGIGLACAKALAAQGAAVYLGVRRLEAGQQIADELIAAGGRAGVVFFDASREESFSGMVDEVAAKEGRLDILVAGQQIADELIAAGGRAGVVFFDASREESFSGMVDEVAAKEGRLDILVNNFGSTDVKTDLDVVNGPSEDFFRIVNTNLKSVYLPSKAAVPLMAKNGGGSIINIGSVGGLYPDLSRTAYGVSKAAIHFLTKDIAVQYARQGVRCNAVLPGFTATDAAYPDLSRTAYGVSKAAIHFLTKDIAVQYARQGVRCNAVLPGFTATDAALNNMSQAFLDLFLKNVPLNRPGRPEDIADAVAFLASDRAAFITGEILPVAGGFGLPTPLYGSYMSAGAKG